MKLEYLYANEKKDGKYIVFQVENRGNFFLSERKCRTIAKQKGLTLAGGCFTDKYIPYDFKENYFIINVPYNTKAQRENAKDKFINNLIAFEDGSLPEDKTIGFLKQAKKAGLHKAQGLYSRACNSI